MRSGIHLFKGHSQHAGRGNHSLEIKSRNTPAPVPHTFRTSWGSAWLITLRARPVWCVSFIMSYQQSTAYHHCIIYSQKAWVYKKAFSDIIISKSDMVLLEITAMFIAELASVTPYDPCSWVWTGRSKSIVGKGKGWLTCPLCFLNTPLLLAVQISIHLCVLDNSVWLGRGCPVGLDSPTFARS